MKIRCCTAAIAAIATITLCLVAMTPSFSAETHDLLSVMQKASRALNCHFVIEDQSAGQLLYTPIPNDDYQPTTIDDLVIYLRQKMPNAVVTLIDHKTVVSIEDKSLATGFGDPLNWMVSFSYLGVVDNLPDALHKQRGVPVERSRGWSTTQMQYDGATQVVVGAQHQSVREILTEGVPLTHYNFIVWDARVIKTKDGELASIHYWGPG